MTILIGSCWGAIAAMMIFKNDAPIWEVAVTIALTMGSNTAAIGQATTKWVINMFVLSMVVSTLFIVINVL